MLMWALIFLVISLVAALFGFTRIAAGAATIARFLFFLFVVLFLIFLILDLLNVGRGSVVPASSIGVVVRNATSAGLRDPEPEAGGIGLWVRRTRVLTGGLPC